MDMPADLAEAPIDVPIALTWNLYEYVVGPHTKYNNTDITKYLHLISNTPPSVLHKVIIENLDGTHVTIGAISEYLLYLCVIVKIEYAENHKNSSPLPDDFEILSPIFINDKHAKYFAKKEFGREWRNTYGVMWFLGRPR